MPRPLEDDVGDIVDPYHVAKVIQAESRGNPRAVSPKGARGLMQIMPATARRYGYTPEDMDDPTKNQAVGIRELARLSQHYGGNMRLAHAAYDWGEGHIDRVGDDESKWPAETRNYVRDIMGPAPPRALEDDVGEVGVVPGASGPSGEPTPTPAAAPEVVPPIGSSGYTMDELAPNRPPNPVPMGAQAGEVAGQTAAQMVGEYGGALGGEVLHIGPTAGGAIGAGISGTTADAFVQLINHARYGTPLNLGTRALLEDFAINSGSSVVSAVIGKLLGGGVSGEAKSLHEATDVGMQAKQRFQEGNVAVEQSLEDQARARQQAELGKVTPQARQEEIAGVTGQTPEKASEAKVPPTEPTKAGVIGPSAQTLDERRDIHGAYFETEDKIGKALGKQYADLRGPYGKNTTPTGGIRQSLEDWDKYYLARGESAPGPVKVLIQDGRALMRHSLLDIPELKVYGELPRAAKRAITPEAKAYQAEGLTPYEPEMDKSDFNHVLAYQQQVEAFARQTDDETAAHFAAEVGKAARASLEQTEGMPSHVHDEIKALNRQYQNYKQVFTRGDARFIRGNPDPIQVAGRIFNQPELTERLAHNASPEGREALREGLGNWLQHNPNALATTNPTEALNRARSIGVLYPGSPLADPKAITYIGATMENIATAPQANAAFQASLDQSSKDAVHEGAIKIRQLALSEAKHLGDADRPFVQQLIQAKTPEEAAQLAIQHFTGMTPESLVQSIASGQDLLKPSLARKIARGAEGGIWIKRMMTDPETWKWMAGMAAAQMAGGAAHIGWYGQMALAGSIPVTRRVVANMFVQGLKDPALAKEFIAGAIPASRMIFQPWAKAAMKGATNEVGAAIMKALTGDPLATPDPRETAPLPAMRAAHRAALDQKDDAGAKDIRKIVVKRLKSGEWKGLDPNIQRQLAPWIREIAIGA